MHLPIFASQSVRLIGSTMSSIKPQRRTILVTGATGQQGQALIAALRPHDHDTNSNLNQPTTSAALTSEVAALITGTSESEIDYHVLALTRNRNSETAKALAREKHVNVVEGDLERRESIKKIFEDVQSEGDRIWGVFAVMAYPGLNKDAEGEERQGKMLADLALEYNVSAYIYSSSLRTGPGYDDQEQLSGRAKVNIERYVQELGERGLPWAIIRPSFFMENFSGFIGSITAGVLKQGLQPETKVRLIAKDDIGNIAAGVFRNFPQFKNTILSLVSESLTIGEIEKEHQRATSRPLSSIPWPLAWFILAINSGARGLIEKLNNDHAVQAQGEYAELDAEIERAKKACPDMRSFGEWAKQQDGSEVGQSGWNQVSLWKLLTGQL
ncbi:hypothetical protein PVAR5_0166 [Paecilomyces variotii No. 5]|uniref:NmrA-like domain-containing protein n=1 Tax=Byssochlamys spectabilis (strain No. 5 / NBRC 109023) TaxID=1356009 RepID=V5FIP9_BYSSN|nr:hypothetical protein PVAR5_0166 [Paecilomyces variotii No. 5]